MSLLYCRHCDTKVDYMLDICPKCGGEIYEKDIEQIDTEEYEKEYKDYVYSIRTTRPLYRLFTLFSVIGLFVSGYFILIKYGLTDVPSIFIGIFFFSLLLLIITKILTKIEKRDGRL